MIEEQFKERMKSEKAKLFLTKLEREQHKDLFFLYAEYNSIRKVAQETNICFKTVSIIINEIKKRCI